MNFFVAFALLMVSTVAFADAAPPQQTIFNQWAKEALVCDSQDSADTGVCTAGSGGDEIVLDVRGYKTVGFDASDSTATGFVCDVYSGADGYDDTAAAIDVSASQITETNPIIVLEGVLRYVWINCTSIDDNVLIVWATATRL